MNTVRTELGVGRGVRFARELLMERRLGNGEAKPVSNKFFQSEEFSYPGRVLAVMDQYLDSFPHEKLSQAVRDAGFAGPIDLMGKIKDFKLQELDQSDFFDFDSEYNRYLNLKKELFTHPTKKDIVFYNSGDHNDFWDAFLKSLSKRYPKYYSNDGDNFTNNITGGNWNLKNHDPFSAAALSLQEDLILLKKQPDGSSRIRDISVCFPSRWNPGEAHDKSVKEVHSIVPKWDDAKLGDVIEAAINGIKVPSQRNTRLIHGFPILSQTTENSIPGVPAGIIYTKENVGDKLFLRLERQKFFRGDNLTGDPRHENLVLMSIKTYVLPLKAIETSKAFAERMLGLYERFRIEYEKEKLQNDRHTFVDYRKGTEEFLYPVLEYLREVVAKPEPIDPLSTIKQYKIPEDAFLIGL